ncbi:MAG: Rrf2 family transcriptional regulator [Clostridiales bacterium]|nr:MAG: Rrf2 family transcriptional regulator [Clostridiales bacterium]
MLISTKGRYALRVMIELAEHKSDEYVPLKVIAEKQSISIKYLENIIPVLSKAGIIDGLKGKGGGYRLNRSPKEYSVGDILRLTEGTLVPVACLNCKPNKCEKAISCRTLPMWEGLNAVITNYLDNYSIADLIDTSNKGEYQI